MVDDIDASQNFGMGFYLWCDAAGLAPEPIDLHLRVLLGGLFRHRRLAHARTCATQTAIMKKTAED